MCMGIVMKRMTYVVPLPYLGKPSLIAEKRVVTSCLLSAFENSPGLRYNTFLNSLTVELLLIR